MRNQRYHPKYRNMKLSLRGRHILIVFSLILLTASIGAAAFYLTDSLAMMNLSKKAMAAAGTSSTVSSQTASKSAAIESSSQAVSSEPSSQSAVLSSSAVEAVAPASLSASAAMDPAVYQAMYPNLYAKKAELAAPAEDKVVYLTFDDGPSNLQTPLLNVLDKYNVKATFFLVGKTDPQSIKDMKEIVSRGSVVGIHSYTHQYEKIYASPAAFLEDFSKMHDLLLNATGVDTHIYRYAGGSVNSYNRKTAKAITEEMNRRGYVYYDWNVSSGDAERGATEKSIYKAVIDGVHGHRQSVVLFHNTKFKAHTLAQMPKIIETLQKEGYRFATLDPSVSNEPYIFRVPSK